jgi:hypothetical protein
MKTPYFQIMNIRGDGYHTEGIRELFNTTIEKFSPHLEKGIFSHITEAYRIPNNKTRKEAHPDTL